MKQAIESDVEDGNPACLSAAELGLQQSRELDRLLDDDAGVGRWQLWWCAILSLYQSVSAFHLYCFMFQTTDKQFWCNEGSDYNITKNSCSMRSLNEDIDGGQGEIRCTGFRFEGDGRDGMTIIEEFGLVCDRKYFVTVVEMTFLAGAAIGSVSSGWISDRYGRKHTLMVFATIQVVFGSIAAFSSSLAMFMTLRVIIGFASMAVAVVSFVLVVELVSGKCRTIIGMLNILPMAVSYVLTAGIAYYIHDWRVLQLVISLPWTALLLIWYCVPESPRWLLASGKLEQLFALLERAARFNGRTLPPDYRKTLQAAAIREATLMEAIATGEEPDALSKGQDLSVKPRDSAPNALSAPSAVEKINPFLVVFNKIYLRTTVLNLVIWLTLILMYFGLTLHMNNLGGDIYINTAVAGCIEAASVIVSIFIVMKISTRLSVFMCVFMTISGICCLLTNFVPQEKTNGVIALAMIAKCVNGANNAIIPIFTAGLYPTEVRNFGVGLGNLAAGIAMILVPSVWLLQDRLPLTVLGICGIVGATALCLIKDSKH